MKVWEIKTHRHGVTLVKAKTIGNALLAFEKFNRGYRSKHRKPVDAYWDTITSCVCLGEVANP